MSEYYVEPKPGDLIEISRLGYQHWAIYVGSGYVIHLGPSGERCFDGQHIGWCCGCGSCGNSGYQYIIA